MGPRRDQSSASERLFDGPERLLSWPNTLLRRYRRLMESWAPEREKREVDPRSRDQNRS